MPWPVATWVCERCGGTLGYERDLCLCGGRGVLRDLLRATPAVPVTVAEAIAELDRRYPGP